jgi:hypothetical protein
MINKLRNFISTLGKNSHFQSHRAITQYALFDRSLVLSFFHVLLVGFYSNMNLFPVFTKAAQLTKLLKLENT